MTWGVQPLGKWRGKMEDGKEEKMSLAKAKVAFGNVLSIGGNRKWGCCVSDSSNLKDTAPSDKTVKTSFKTPREQPKDQRLHVFRRQTVLP